MLDPRHRGNEDDCRGLALGIAWIAAKHLVKGQSKHMAELIALHFCMLKWWWKASIRSELGDWC